MAMAEEIVLQGADASSCSSGSDEDVEEASCCPSPLSDNDNINHVPDDDNHMIKQAVVNDEVTQAGVNLSNEALKLLRHASRSVLKRKQRRRATITSSLYTELQALQNLIPPHNFGDVNTQPCVITDALGYLKILKQEIRDLNERLMKAMESKARTSQDAQDAQVEVICLGQRLEIHVSCNKRIGLLTELILVLESFGLVFDDMDTSCHHRLLFQASSTQKRVHLLDKQAIRRAILRTIHKN